MNARRTAHILLTEADTGNCYDVHADYLADLHLKWKWDEDKDALNEMNKWVLIHGIPTGQGPIAGLKFGHCWLESADRNTVMDLANGRRSVMDKRLYYAAGQIDPKDNWVYKPAEVFKKMVSSGTYGPWDSKPPR